MSAIRHSLLAVPLVLLAACAGSQSSSQRVPGRTHVYDPAPSDPARQTGEVEVRVTDADTGEALIGGTAVLEGTALGEATDLQGIGRIAQVPPGVYRLAVRYVGYETATVDEVKVQPGHRTVVEAALIGSGSLDEVVVAYERPMMDRSAMGGRTASDMSEPASRQGRAEGVAIATRGGAAPPMPGYAGAVMASPAPGARPMAAPDREGYAAVEEVGFRTALDAPLSTFSIDVDRASYANARRFLTQGTLPPDDAVRIEEFVNAFDYGLAGPADGRPFAVSTEITEAPWAPAHHLVRIGLQGRRIDTEALPPANLVFLLDVSGSMDAPDKLPLVQRALRLLVREMRDQDRVAIVVYAGAAGVVLPPTAGRDRGRILEALDRLRAGGSTAGGEGLRLAYQTARQHFDPAATNRVILATDGDFNIGESSDAAMQRLIEEERASGVFLSVLGVGRGNLQDAKMETLADHGNGNYSYLDSIREAERVLVREFGGTLFAIAKDVKLQVEFNPARVAGYRLIGYENRTLAAEDFNDDAKDAGELGAGHTVTALYEIVPVGVEVPTAGVDGLRYQRAPGLTDAASSDEWLTVALRYKPATDAGTFADESVRLAVPVAGTATPLARASEATRWAVSVTEAALLLGASDFAPGASYDHALALARSARGADPHGDRAEFIRLIETARALAESDGDEIVRPVVLRD